MMIQTTIDTKKHIFDDLNVELFDMIQINRMTPIQILQFCISFVNY